MGYTLIQTWMLRGYNKHLVGYNDIMGISWDIMEYNHGMAKKRDGMGCNRDIMGFDNDIVGISWDIMGHTTNKTLWVCLNVRYFRILSTPSTPPASQNPMVHTPVLGKPYCYRPLM